MAECEGLKCRRFSLIRDQWAKRGKQIVALELELDELRKRANDAERGCLAIANALAFSEEKADSEFKVRERVWDENQTLKTRVAELEAALGSVHNADWGSH